MQINIVNLRKEMEVGLNRSVYPKAQAIIKRDFNTAKNQLIRSFEKAKPSVALVKVAEMGREERSSYEDGFVERGNLYSFFGMEDDRNPVEEVKEVLLENITLDSLTKGSVNNQGVYVITGKVSVVTLDEINNTSNLSWGAGRGWIDALTHGLRGLPNFLFGDFSDKSYSRSGAGLQTKKETTKTGRGAFKPFEGNYLSEFLERFKNKIRGNR